MSNALRTKDILPQKYWSQIHFIGLTRDGFGLYADPIAPYLLFVLHARSATQPWALGPHSGAQHERSLVKTHVHLRW